MLRKVEALIQAEFKDGLPPHLWPNATSLERMPRTEQSRIFVSSHSDFKSLHAKDIQRILRDRLILVHGNPLDYEYGWDLESFGRVYDVDRKLTVQGESDIDLFILFNKISVQLLIVWMPVIPMLGIVVRPYENFMK
jgi:hypothetical protein